ncbi:MAG: hypothetical protein R3F11_18445 [Verrucomicrobiales bacterium]
MVHDASGYRLYRSAADGGPTTLAPIQDILDPGTLEFTDAPSPEGIYHYAIASLRTANGQTVPGDRRRSARRRRIGRHPARRAAQPPLTLASNGILNEWAPPAGIAETITYRLYRSADPIADVSALSPLAEGLTSVSAVDPSPTHAEPYYAITAADEAGNESPPSNTELLNADLFPVNALEIAAAAGQAPAISWANNSPSISGYDLYRGDRDTGVKLNAALLPGTAFTDQSYAGGDRLYTVVTLDTNAMESLPRSLALPDVTCDLAPDQSLKLGLMNGVRWIVRNRSATYPLTNAVMKMTVGGIAHQSAAFSLAPGDQREVNVVVGGYASLAGSTSAGFAAELESRPQAGERIAFTHEGSIALEEGGLVVQVLPGDFARGGIGRVRYRIQNTAAETIEILTARANGSQPSPDLRFDLLDEDENLLDGADVLQHLGESIVTLANGESVLRLAGGEEYTSPEFQLNVPEDAADELTVQFAVDAVFSKRGTPEEVALAGPTVRAPALIAETTYLAQIIDATPEVSAGGQTITITGKAVLRANPAEPARSAPVRVGITVRGFDRVADLVSDSSGDFTHVPAAAERRRHLQRVGDTSGPERQDAARYVRDQQGDRHARHHPAFHREELSAAGQPAGGGGSGDVRDESAARL